MQVKLIADNFIADGWPSPQKGQIREVTTEFGRHLVSTGLAIELKIQPRVPVEKKQEAPSSVSQAVPASIETTAPRRRGRRKKS